MDSSNDGTCRFLVCRIEERSNKAVRLNDQPPFLYQRSWSTGTIEPPVGKLRGIRSNFKVSGDITLVPESTLLRNSHWVSGTSRHP